MIIRNLLNDTTVAEAGLMIIGGIGAGIYRPIRLEQAGSVTSVQFIYSRNGATKATVVVAPYEGAVLDLSMMAAATPSITESINAGLGFTDFAASISILYMEGTLKSIGLRVIHSPAADARFASTASTRNLSDYGNGLFNQLDFSCAPFLNSPLTGAPFNFALRYGQYTSNSDGRLRCRNNGTGTSFAGSNATTSSALQAMGEFRTYDDADVCVYARF